MAVTFRIDGARRLVFITVEGNLNRAMLDAALLRLSAAPGFDPAFDTIADFSQVTYLNLDIADIQRLVRSTAPASKGRIAIITGEDQGRYSLGVYFKALSEGLHEVEQCIFRTLDEAHAWLGTPETASA